MRLWGDPGFNLQVLPEMKHLIERLVPIAANSPVIGDVFTTQAGIHQAGVARQEDAPGGLIYLAYNPALVGRTKAERTVIGAMSGSEGIVAILNQEAEQRGLETRYTTMSRVVKDIYDRVQDAYDGDWDEKTKHFVGYRTTFFTPEEIWEMAASYKSDGA
jgi:isopropylmalate/homocitrate/citramalate synthase